MKEGKTGLCESSPELELALSASWLPEASGSDPLCQPCTPASQGVIQSDRARLGSSLGTSCSEQLGHMAGSRPGNKGRTGWS